MRSDGSIKSQNWHPFGERKLTWSCYVVKLGKGCSREVGDFKSIRILPLMTSLIVTSSKCTSYYNKSQQVALFRNFILVKNSTCFGQTYCPSSGVLMLYSQQ